VRAVTTLMARFR